MRPRPGQFAFKPNPRPGRRGLKLGQGKYGEGDGVRWPLAEHFGLVGDRLRPPGRGCVLRAHTAAHRQRMGAARVRIIEDYSDIAAVGIAAGPAHSGAKRVGQRDPQ